MGAYHAGSLAVQKLVGVRERADHMGRAFGQDITMAVAAFLGLQPLLVVGGPDPVTGRVWTSPVAGTAGFVRATGPRQISVAGGPPPTDPLATALATPGTPVGSIVLDPRTRRRLRLNGRARPTAAGFAVEADQVFGNCPRYIQRRETYERVEGRTPGASRRTGRLEPADMEFVRAADTFFVSTVHGDGADVSHRGGNPGFVRVASPQELRWPDYSGNAMFLTLGNLYTDPRAGLLFLDWETGSALQLTGEARTEFSDAGERTVCFTVTEAVRTTAAVPLRWSAPEYSPANPDD
ncbi:pyridoxamine 5'-phosphate oxidase family protein [Streptomyces sp. NPDC014991]|uniref:pyridoxamine 5'-phosphate oxidase family protein n=1 Tax=Streptomyces sp. NPDC014991 TaxID=3364935 RepID=UPI0036F71601